MIDCFYKDCYKIAIHICFGKQKTSLFLINILAGCLYKGMQEVFTAICFDKVWLFPISLFMMYYGLGLHVLHIHYSNTSRGTGTAFWVYYFSMWMVESDGYLGIAVLFLWQFL